MPLHLLTVLYYFNPLSPCGERLCSPAKPSAVKPNFNPLSPCGERPPKVFFTPVTYGFQSTLPVRGETYSTFETSHNTGDFNPLSPCGERPGIYADMG